jgi:outer membrane immunogenic protein
MRRAEKMKKLSIAAVVLAGLASPTLAGGPTVVADDPMPAAAPAPVAAHDWSGPYVGLGYGRGSGTYVVTPGASYDLDSGTTTSLFAGYLMQRGSLVFGGELAYSKARGITNPTFATEEVDRIVDLKGKVGVAAGRAMFYGVLGYSSVRYQIPVLSNGFTTKGYSYGLGVDVAMTDKITVGVEYLNRTTDGDTFVPGTTADIDLNTLSVRVGLSF